MTTQQVIVLVIHAQNGTLVQADATMIMQHPLSIPFNNVVSVMAGANLTVEYMINLMPICYLHIHIVFNTQQHWT